MSILVANIGSTSFKYRLFAGDGETVLGEGRVERIGQPGSACPDYDTAIQGAIADLTRPRRPLGRLSDLAAIGFKAVHAGPVTGARFVDDEVLAAMEAVTFLAPAHNPPYVAAMRSFRRVLPETPLVALFETAFFDRMPASATTYAVPYEWKEELGVRRYGFHGASHRAAAERVQALLGRPVRHISCHLGGSSSVAGIRDGVAVETSFGLSPQSGLPQNNRVGDLDVFAALFVMKQRDLDPDAMADLLATRSGLAGISGLSGDVRDLEQAAAAGNARARLALDVFVHAVRHHLGACLVALGGVDVAHLLRRHRRKQRVDPRGGLRRPRGPGPRARPRAERRRVGEARLSARRRRPPSSSCPPTRNELWRARRPNCWPAALPRREGTMAC